MTRNKTVGISAAVALAVVAGLLLRAPYAVTGGERALKIGIIDLNRIVAECQMGKDLVKELDDAYKVKRVELEKQRDEIQKMDDELKVLDVTSEEAGAKRRVLTEKSALLKAQANIATAEWQEKYAEAHKTVYTEIFKDLESFRKTNGFDLLLRKDALDLKDLGPMQVKALLRNNSVLCNAPDMDVTDKIIKLLDQGYTKK